LPEKDTAMEMKCEIVGEDSRFKGVVKVRVPGVYGPKKGVPLPTKRMCFSSGISLTRSKICSSKYATLPKNNASLKRITAICRHSSRPQRSAPRYVPSVYRDKSTMSGLILRSNNNPTESATPIMIPRSRCGAKASVQTEVIRADRTVVFVCPPGVDEHRDVDQAREMRGVLWCCTKSQPGSNAGPRPWRYQRHSDGYFAAHASSISRPFVVSPSMQKLISLMYLFITRWISVGETSPINSMRFSAH